MIDSGDFWWENVTGPQLLVEELVAHLGEGKTVLIQSENRLPWRGQLMDCVAQKIPSVSIRSVEWPQVLVQKNEVASVFLRELAPGKEAACPVDYQAQLRFLKDQGVFAGAVVWVDARNVHSWTELRRFLSDYRSKELERDGGFVVELSSEQEISMPLAKHMELVSYQKYVYKNDIRLFSSILVSKYNKADRAMWEYAAAVSTELAGRDVELIPEFLQCIDFKIDDPITVFVSMGAEFQDIEMSVWKAQLQVAFPLIEMERIRITSEYADLINQALDSEYWDPLRERTGFIMQRGELGLEVVKDAAELELGTMVRMMALKRSEDHGQNLLAFPELGLRTWISNLTEYRNKLAHHCVCMPEEIANLLCTCDN